MALEVSDLNDGTILKQTKQNQDARGNIQFEITLPSGRVLKSEFVNKDDARKALYAWIESVKQQAVADSDAERMERAAKSKRQGKMDIERRPGDDKPLFRAGGARAEDKPPEPSYEANDYGTAERQLAKLTPGPIVPEARVVEDTDPLEFARRNRTYWTAKVAELQNATKKMRQWSAVVKVLETEEEPNV